MVRVFIVAAKRTPFGRFRGALSACGPLELAGAAATAVLDRMHRSTVDQVILGQVLSAGHGMNVARQLAIQVGLPLTTPAYTVNMMCGSGMQSVLLAAQTIRSGAAHVVLAGGVESMSQAPMLIRRPEKGRPLVPDDAVDSMQHDGLFDSFSGQFMVETVEELAQEMKISRREQDAWAERSQKLYAGAASHGVFSDELTPVNQVTQDEHPRPGVDRGSLAALQPISGSAGTITAGNASGINDGAAMLLLSDEKTVHQNGWTPLAEFIDGTVVGCEPKRMGLGPVHAIRKLLTLMNRRLESFDHLEINEAFSAQILACLKQLEVRINLAQPENPIGLIEGCPIQVNPQGGAVAIGHPLAASGARLLVHLAWQIARGRSKAALASLCIGGGMGIAAALSSADI